jgi:hypothetical protein
MKRAWRAAQRTFAGLAVLLGAVAGSAASEPPVCAGHDLGAGKDLTTALARRAGDLVNSQGLLWRIEKDGVASSYVYGTIHTSDAGAIPWPMRRPN